MDRKRKILLALTFMLWFQFIISMEIIKIDGNSMNNTLEDGQYYPAINKNYAKIERFDIVIIDSKVLDEMIIKRVIGLPGENIKAENGKIYINGEEIKQSFDYIFDPFDFEITLRDDEYFVLGDNRPISLDSRYIGPIPQEEIQSVLT